MKDVRVLLVAFLVLAATGCTGDPGSPGMPGEPGPTGPAGSNAPSLSSVAPAYGVPARQLIVVISGDDTQFDATSTADFGEDITVDAVRVASPTSLVCDITILEGARIGTRDVTVSTNGAALVSTTGFEVVPSLGVTMPGGPAVQGDVVDLMQLYSVDDEPLTYPGLVESAGMYLATDRAFDDGVGWYTGYIDVFAPASYQLVWQNYGGGASHFYSAPIAIEARTPTALVPASALAVAMDTRSKLFSVAPTGLGILSFTFTGVGAGVSTQGVIAPASGVLANAVDRFPISEGRGLATVTRAGANTFYLVVGGQAFPGTTAAHTLTINTVHTPVTALTAESGTDHPLASPQALTPPAIVDGTLATELVDAYSIVVPNNATLEVWFADTTPGVLRDYAVPVYLLDADSGSLGTLYEMPNLPGTQGLSARVRNTTGASAVYRVGIEPPGGVPATYTLAVRVF